MEKASEELSQEIQRIPSQNEDRRSKVLPCKTGDVRVPRKPKVREKEWGIKGKTPEFPSPKSNLTKVRVKNSKYKLTSSN